MPGLDRRMWGTLDGLGAPRTAGRTSVRRPPARTSVRHGSTRVRTNVRSCEQAFVNVRGGAVDVQIVAHDARNVKGNIRTAVR